MLEKARWILIGSLCALAGIVLWPCSGKASVIILANRTDGDVRFSLPEAKENPKEITLKSGETIPLSARHTVKLDLRVKDKILHYLLNPDTAHFFGKTPAGVELQEIGLGESARDEKTHKSPTSSGAEKPSVPGPKLPLTIRVKILVDDEEPSLPAVWEKRLRKRILAASEIFESNCRIKFEVVEAETWKSDNRLTTFKELLKDFESHVKPGTADLAIGFMSQRCELQDGPRHLGGTRFPFHPYVLVREWTPRSEPERLEVLVHELGHHVGAVHSPEPTSVMRPNLGDGKSLAREFRIGFDPPNALAINLFAEARAAGAKNLAEVDAGRRQRLIEIYGELARALPTDATALNYVKALKGEVLQNGQRIAASSAQVAATRQVMEAIFKAAEANHRLPINDNRVGGAGPFRVTGDALTELYIRTAAKTAQGIPKEHAASAFLLALGLAIDDSEIISGNPLTRELCRQIESLDERDRRLNVLDVPTMDRRRDSAQHFVVSCALTAIFGTTLAESAGILKEQMDMQPGGSGFSFADLAADFSGVTFAGKIKSREISLERVEDSFRVNNYLVPMKDWEDGLSKTRFLKEYGSVTDARFLKKKSQIQDRINTLPAYKKEDKK